MDCDPFNTFDWIMKQSEARNLTSFFYFIAGRTNRNKDASYNLNHNAVRYLLRSIFSRGHKIGIHFSFESYLSKGNN